MTEEIKYQPERLEATVSKEVEEYNGIKVGDTVMPYKFNTVRFGMHYQPLMDKVIGIPATVTKLTDLYAQLSNRFCFPHCAIEKVTLTKDEKDGMVL